MNPLRDCHLRTQQRSRRHTKNFAAKCIPRGLRKNVPCWDEECKTLYCSFLRAPVETDSDRAASFLLSRLGSGRSGRSNGKKLLIPSTSRTPVARRWAPSINLLAGLDAPLVCAPSQQTPSPRNSWRTGHTRMGAASPPGSSTSTCPTDGSPNIWGKQCLCLFQARGACCRHQAPEAREVSGIGLHLPGVYTPSRVGSQILVLRFPHFLHAPTQNHQDMEKSTNNCDP